MRSRLKGNICAFILPIAFRIMPVLEQFEEFNSAGFREKPEWSRRSAFETFEKAKLVPLPSCRYEVRETAMATVGKDSYVKSSLDG